MTAPQGQDRLVKSAYGVLRRLVKNLEPQYELKANQIESIVLKALEQHGAHLVAHGIEQKTIDPFKLACWLGCCLLEQIEEQETDHQSQIVIDALLKTLKEFLIKESDWNLVVPKSTMKLLKSMLLHQKKGDDKHGIWMNGLYASFHCSLTSWNEGQAFKIPL